MDISGERILRTLGYMAWERAKGELLSILTVYWTSENDYERMKKIIYEFIEKIEGESPLA